MNAAALIDFYRKKRGKQEVTLLSSDQSFVDDFEIPSVDEFPEADQSSVNENPTATSMLPESRQDLDRMFVCPGCHNHYETHRKLMLHLNHWKRSIMKNAASSHGLEWNSSDVQQIIDKQKTEKKLFY